MKRYQIRVPESFAVEDIIEQMASKGWDSIIRDLDAEKILVPLKNYRHFQNAVYHAVTPHVRIFSLCGKPDFCTDQICICRLDNRPKPMPANGDRILHLFLDSDIDTFLNEIVENAFETLDGIIKNGRKLSVKGNLYEAFETILAHYLYFNPVCGTTPFCEYSETFSAAAK